MRTAIVTDAHYRTSVALIRDLAKNGVPVIACESEAFPDPPGFASRWVTRCVTLPKEGALDALYNLCAELAETETPVLLPVGAATLAALAENRPRFDAVCALCIPTKEQLALFNDKEAVHDLAEKNGLPVPKEYAPLPGESEQAFAARVTFPCVVKPTCGEKFGLHAEQRYRIVRTADELLSALRHFEQLTGSLPLVQEYLPGNGMGCSVLAQNGQILCSIGHRRIREYPVSGGPSSCCTVMDERPLLKSVEPLIRAAGYSGVAMFEFKEAADGSPELLEINPRVWGTYPLTHVSGSDFSLFWYLAAAGLPLPEYCRPKQVRMVYFPSDPAAMAGYWRRGERKRALGVIGDVFRPGTRCGLLELSDPRPFFRYLRGLFSRRRSSC